MKFRPGPLAGQLSGSLGSSVASHNRYGAYFRTRVTPTNPSSFYQQFVRSALATASEGYRNLTAAQQLQWAEWARENPVIDRIGQSQILQGNAAYVQLGSRLIIAGESLPTSPPATPTPTGLLTLTLTVDVSDTKYELAYTATPLGAGKKLWIQACMVSSPTIKFIKNRLRYIEISAAAQASPYDVWATIVTRLGTPVAGQTAYATAAVFDTATGLLSLPTTATATVTA